MILMIMNCDKIFNKHAKKYLEKHILKYLINNSIIKNVFNYVFKKEKMFYIFVTLI